jgi:hypothetical protein
MLEAFEERFQTRVADFFDFLRRERDRRHHRGAPRFPEHLRARDPRSLRELAGRVFEWSLASSRFGRLVSGSCTAAGVRGEKLTEFFGDATLASLPDGPRGPRGILLTTHDLVRNEELFLSNFPLKTGKPNFRTDVEGSGRRRGERAVRAHGTSVRGRDGSPTAG